MRTKTPELAEEKEKLILDAARRRFALFGYGKATMDEIADEVRMAKASLYYYFPTKEAIFRQVIRYEQYEFLRNMEDVLKKSTDASQKLLMYVSHRQAFFDTLLNLNTLSLESWMELRPLFKDLLDEFAHEEERLITNIIREGKLSGEFDVSSSRKTALLLLHILQGMHVLMFKSTAATATLREEFNKLGKESESVVQMMLTGLRTRNAHK